MKILLVEPFYGGSHEKWLNGLMSLPHEFHCISLPERYWKWRMTGGAITLAKKYRKANFIPDLVITSSMLDVTTFRVLSGLTNTPLLTYFHENQFAYPESPDYSNRADNHYRFISYTSALASNWIAFNSKYNRDTFFEGLEEMLRSFPEFRNMETIDTIRRKSSVLPLAFNFKDFHFQVFDSITQNPAAPKQTVFPENTARKKFDADEPVILWNHRWEHDKNPDEFFDALFWADSQQLPFRLIVAGRSYSNVPPVFKKAEKKLRSRIIHFGYAPEAEYGALLQKATLAPVSSLQDFFGISVVEAAYAGAIPILPARLAYPEVIPPNKFPECYYDGAKTFIGALTHFLTNWQSLRKQNIKTASALHKRLNRFAWKNLAGQYERTFQRALTQKTIL